jgi:antitoxin component YwqK of YwqJK toxin-antitoxin module
MREEHSWTFDWWRGVARHEVVDSDQPEQKHGVWTTWHPNGEKLLQGRYEVGRPVGTFTWRFDTGQKQLAGQYVAGQPDGDFMWWHPNGQKQMEGSYSAGVETGRWRRWSADGRLVADGDFAAVQGADGSPLSLTSTAAP